MLYGAIFGDMAGSTYEWHPVKNKKFETFPIKSHFTDDTIMTLAVASWLSSTNRTSDALVKSMQYFGSLYPHVGYGRNFYNWLRDENPQPYYSWGNGSAMRVSPCGWAAKTFHEAETLAEESAKVTHSHPEGIKGAQAVASAIYMAKIGSSKELIKDYIETAYSYNLSRTIEEIKSSGYKFDVSCQDSVPEAIIAFLESNSFEEAVRLAIYLGGDADTQAAIAGSIAEAFYGIPTSFVEALEKRLDKTLLDVLNQFNNKYNNE